jgi:hypothetical protein
MIAGPKGCRVSRRVWANQAAFQPARAITKCPLLKLITVAARKNMSDIIARFSQ